MGKRNMKGLHIYDYNYMAFWERQNCGDSEKNSGFQEWGWEKLENM